jgi:hypothetical protein
LDQEIELAEPSFIPLGQKEAAEAVRLLAALIRAVPARGPRSPVPPPREFPSPADLADGSPFVPRNRGKARSTDAAGGGP